MNSYHGHINCVQIFYKNQKISKVDKLIFQQLAKNRNNMPFNNDVQKLLFTVSKWRFLDLQNDSNFSCAAKNYFSHLHH